MTAPQYQDAALLGFMEYFRKNYPGPDTIIGKPDWHSPRLFQAAKHFLYSPEALAASPEVQALIEAATASLRVQIEALSSPPDFEEGANIGFALGVDDCRKKVAAAEARVIVDPVAIEAAGKRWHGEDHRVVAVRWEPYKPDGARQMKAKGRWQEMVGSGDYWRWQNCERPAALRSLKKEQ